MKTILLLLPVIISCFFQSAHYFRSNQMGFVVMWALAPLMLFVKRRWVSYVFPVLLLIAAINWINVTRTIWKVRMMMGRPGTRMAVILGCVALFTILSSLVFLTKRLKNRYRGNGGSGVPGAAAFILTAVTLVIIELKMWPPGLLLERFVRTGGWIEAFWISFYAGFLADTMMRPDISKKWRYRVWSIFSFVFFLQLILGLFVDKRFLLTGKLHIPVPALIVAGPVYRAGGLTMLKLFLVTILLVGPAWCSWLCYIGSWDDACSRRKKRPVPLPKWRGYLRIVLLLVVLLTAYLLHYFSVGTTFAGYIAITFGALGVIIMLTWSRKSGAMTHCTSYCPIGFLATTLGKINPFRIRIEDKCDGCGKCRAECRYDALSDEDLKKKRPGSSCTLCGDCIAACKEEHIHYKFFSLSREKARLLFFVLIVSLHAVFMGIARI